MIDSIAIKNYRNLKELQINSFAPVNLITGKNNTGKSSLLEAVAISVTQADLGVLFQLLSDRGENYTRNTNSNTLERNIKTFSSLFSDREKSIKEKRAISIKCDNNDQLLLEIRFVNFMDKDVSADFGEDVTIKRVAVEETDAGYADSRYGLEIRTGDHSRIRSLDTLLQKSSSSKNGGDSFQYIRSRSIDTEANGILWDNITLTDKESYVIEALRIIDPNIERLAFIQEPSGMRSAVAKLNQVENVVPIRSMGDGINRIFTVILAMVNAENGCLLVDEIENGLHHMVQTTLWELIFILSAKLNVQVFATTHSNDTIRGFQYVLNRLENKDQGKLIRLDYKKDKLMEVEFNASELEIAANNNIEIR